MKSRNVKALLKPPEGVDDFQEEFLPNQSKFSDCLLVRKFYIYIILNQEICNVY